MLFLAKFVNTEKKTDL